VLRIVKRKREKERERARYSLKTRIEKCLGKSSPRQEKQ
jgi:hypothetical protein